VEEKGEEWKRRYSDKKGEYPDEGISLNSYFTDVFLHGEGIRLKRDYWVVECKEKYNKRGVEGGLGY